MGNLRYFVWKRSQGFFGVLRTSFFCATLFEDDAKMICNLLLKSGIDCFYIDFPYGFETVDYELECKFLSKAFPECDDV